MLLAGTRVGPNEIVSWLGTFDVFPDASTSL